MGFGHDDCDRNNFNTAGLQYTTGATRILNRDAFLAQRFHFLQRAGFAAKLRRRVMQFVVVLGGQQTVPAGGYAAIGALYGVNHRPGRSIEFGGEDKPVDPKEDQPADEVGDGRARPVGCIPEGTG